MKNDATTMNLGSAFDFTPSEVTDNRAGRLSDAQRATLMKVLGRHLDRQRPLPVVGLAGLVIGVGLLATAILRGISRAGALPLIGLALLAALGAGILIARRPAPQPDDPAAAFDALIRDDRIDVLSGPVQFSDASLLVAGETVGFLTRPVRGAADTLSVDRTYTVYTIEMAGTRLLLSMEITGGQQGI